MSYGAAHRVGYISREEIGAVLDRLVRDAEWKRGRVDEYDMVTVLEDLTARLRDVVADVTEDREYETGGPTRYEVVEASDMRDPEETQDLSVYASTGESSTEIDPHIFEAAHSPGSCTAMVMRNGYGDACGLPPASPVHVRPSFESGQADYR